MEEDAACLRPEHLRLFLAIAVPETVRAELKKTQLQLQRALPQALISWTRPEQFHLTLKFLGNVATGQVDSLVQLLHKVCVLWAPLRMSACDLGCFPNWNRPRVLWAGVSDAQQTLPQLQQALESAVQPCDGQGSQGNFAGHVTLARFKRLHPQEMEVLRALSGRIAHQSFGDWWANEVLLMQSELARNGARHTCLARVRLEAA